VRGTAPSAPESHYGGEILPSPLYNGGMNRAFIPLLVAAFLVLAAVPARADFEDGLKAFNAGDSGRAYDIWLPMAEKGHAHAQFALGILLMQPVSPDELKDKPYYGRYWTERHCDAKKWYRRAAEQGHPRAQFELGIMYTRGDCPEPGKSVQYELEQAVIWYERAAAQRFASAMWYVAKIYATRQFKGYDEIEAAKWKLLYYRRRLGTDFKTAYPEIHERNFGELTAEQMKEAERRAEAYRYDFGWPLRPE
jgi:hypothetical protein